MSLYTELVDLDSLIREREHKTKELKSEVFSKIKKEIKEKVIGENCSVNFRLTDTFMFYIDLCFIKQSGEKKVEISFCSNGDSIITGSSEYLYLSVYNEISEIVNKYLEFKK